MEKISLYNNNKSVYWNLYVFTKMRPRIARMNKEKYINDLLDEHIRKQELGENNVTRDYEITIGTLPARVRYATTARNVTVGETGSLTIGGSTARTNVLGSVLRWGYLFNSDNANLVQALAMSTFESNLGSSRESVVAFDILPAVKALKVYSVANSDYQFTSVNDCFARLKQLTGREDAVDMSKIKDTSGSNVPYITRVNQNVTVPGYVLFEGEDRYYPSGYSAQALSNWMKAAVQHGVYEMTSGYFPSNWDSDPNSLFNIGLYFIRHTTFSGSKKLNQRGPYDLSKILIEQNVSGNQSASFISHQTQHMRMTSTWEYKFNCNDVHYGVNTTESFPDDWSGHETCGLLFERRNHRYAPQWQDIGPSTILDRIQDDNWMFGTFLKNLTNAFGYGEMLRFLKNSNREVKTTSKVDFYPYALKDADILGLHTLANSLSLQQLTYDPKPASMVYTSSFGTFLSQVVNGVEVSKPNGHSAYDQFIAESTANTATGVKKKALFKFLNTYTQKADRKIDVVQYDVVGQNNSNISTYSSSYLTIGYNTRGELEAFLKNDLPNNLFADFMILFTGTISVNVRRFSCDTAYDMVLLGIRQLASILSSIAGILLNIVVNVALFGLNTFGKVLGTIGAVQTIIKALKLSNPAYAALAIVSTLIIWYERIALPVLNTWFPRAELKPVLHAYYELYGPYGSYEYQRAMDNTHIVLGAVTAVSLASDSPEIMDQINPIIEAGLKGANILVQDAVAGLNTAAEEGFEERTRILESIQEKAQAVYDAFEAINREFSVSEFNRVFQFSGMMSVGEEYKLRRYRYQPPRYEHRYTSKTAIKSKRYYGMDFSRTG
jgi:hypothetical protein